MKKQFNNLLFSSSIILFMLITISCTSEEEGANGYTYMAVATEQEKNKKCKKITEQNEEECKKLSDELEEKLKDAQELARLASGIIIEDEPRPCPEISTCMPMPDLLRTAYFLDKDGISYSIEMLNANQQTIVESVPTDAPKNLQAYKYKISDGDYLGNGTVIVSEYLKGKIIDKYVLEVTFTK